MNDIYDDRIEMRQGIVTAGHPSNDNLYYSVFPFSVGEKKSPLWIAFVVVAALFVLLIRLATKARPGQVPVS